LLEALHEAAGDQAAGLRRLFGTRASQVIAFVSGGESCGRTPLVVQTAAALAQAGQGVVIIDENPAPNNVLAAFGVKPRHDLLDLARGLRSARQIMQAVAPSLRAIAAARCADELPRVDAVAAEYLDSGLRQIQQDAAFVLIDCATGRGGRISLLARTARHVAVVVAAQSAAITHAYALIKVLARERGPDGFQVVITRARSDEEAQAIFDNLRRTAREHLGVRLDYLGACRQPRTDHLADALQSRLPLAARDAGGGGFLPFEPASGPVRGVPGHAPKRLESVV
jgi:flagellar biosynthesis protein FlhG